MKLLPLFLLALFSVIFLKNEAAKILVIFPSVGLSQYILVLPYLKALTERGHEITAITAYPQKEPLTNWRDIPALEIHEAFSELVKNLEFTGSRWYLIRMSCRILELINAKVFESQSVQQLLNSNETFDLVIAETISNEPLYGFAQHFNASLIGISSYGTDRNIDELVGNISPLSYLPTVDSGFTEHMSFWERLQNLYAVTLEFVYMRLVYYPRQEVIYKRQFPNAKVSMMELRRSFALMLLNQHESFGPARPYVPNMIPVGGFHIQHKPQPLPEDMAKFIASYPEGVIYFSLGSNVKSEDLPQQTIDTLLKTFASLQQGVMWKFESSELPNKPKNVFISKWFPQPDILAHPNVKLFITHGGLLSTIEAVYHGKPVIGIPFFFDQFSNVRRAVESGYGLRIDLSTLSMEDFKHKIERVLNEPEFSKRAKQLSKLFHDKPMKPLDLAIYWTEYVLRHKGAPHLRVASQRLNFFQIHSLDTMLVLYGGSLLVVLIILWALSKVICCLLNRTLHSKGKEKLS